MNLILQIFIDTLCKLFGVVVFLCKCDIAILYFKENTNCINVVYKDMNTFRKNLRKPTADDGSEYETYADLIKK